MKHTLATITFVIAAALVGIPDARADENAFDEFKEDASNLGGHIGKAGKDLGKQFGKSSKEIGKDFMTRIKKLGKTDTKD